VNNHWEAAQRQRDYLEGATLRELENLALRRKAERERCQAVATLRAEAALRWSLRIACAIIGVGVVLWVLSTFHF
jgi:hypothetical protein